MAGLALVKALEKEIGLDGAYSIARTHLINAGVDVSASLFEAPVLEGDVSLGKIGFGGSANIGLINYREEGDLSTYILRQLEEVNTDPSTKIAKGNGRDISSFLRRLASRRKAADGPVDVTQNNVRAGSNETAIGMLANSIDNKLAINDGRFSSFAKNYFPATDKKSDVASLYNGFEGSGFNPKFKGTHNEGYSSWTAGAEGHGSLGIGINDPRVDSSGKPKDGQDISTKILPDLGGMKLSAGAAASYTQIITASNARFSDAVDVEGNKTLGDSRKLITAVYDEMQKDNLFAYKTHVLSDDPLMSGWINGFAYARAQDKNVQTEHVKKFLTDQKNSFSNVSKLADLEKSVAKTKTSLDQFRADHEKLMAYQDMINSGSKKSAKDLEATAKDMITKYWGLDEQSDAYKKLLKEAKSDPAKFVARTRDNFDIAIGLLNSAVTSAVMYATDNEVSADYKEKLQNITGHQEDDDKVKKSGYLGLKADLTGGKWRLSEADFAKQSSTMRVGYINDVDLKTNAGFNIHGPSLGLGSAINEHKNQSYSDGLSAAQNKALGEALGLTAGADGSYTIPDPSSPQESVRQSQIKQDAAARFNAANPGAAIAEAAKSLVASKSLFSLDLSGSLTLKNRHDFPNEFRQGQFAQLDLSANIGGFLKTIMSTAIGVAQSDVLDHLANQMYINAASEGLKFSSENAGKEVFRSALAAQLSSGLGGSVQLLFRLGDADFKSTRDPELEYIQVTSTKGSNINLGIPDVLSYFTPVSLSASFSSSQSDKQVHLFRANGFMMNMTEFNRTVRAKREDGKYIEESTRSVFDRLLVRPIVSDDQFKKTIKDFGIDRVLFADVGGAPRKAHLIDDIAQNGIPNKSLDFKGKGFMQTGFENMVDQMIKATSDNSYERHDGVGQIGDYLGQDQVINSSKTGETKNEYEKAKESNKYAISRFGKAEATQIPEKISRERAAQLLDQMRHADDKIDFLAKNRDLLQFYVENMTEANDRMRVKQWQENFPVVPTVDGKPGYDGSRREALGKLITGKGVEHAVVDNVSKDTTNKALHKLTSDLKKLDGQANNYVAVYDGKNGKGASEQELGSIVQNLKKDPTITTITLVSEKNKNDAVLLNQLIANDPLLSQRKYEIGYFNETPEVGRNHNYSDFGKRLFDSKTRLAPESFELKNGKNIKNSVSTRSDSSSELRSSIDTPEF